MIKVDKKFHPLLRTYQGTHEGNKSLEGIGNTTLLHKNQAQILRGGGRDLGGQTNGGATASCDAPAVCELQIKALLGPRKWAISNPREP